MPFLSRDWRSPGERWVRFDGGWERSKVLLTGGYCLPSTSADEAEESSMIGNSRNSRRKQRGKSGKAGRRRHDSTSSHSSSSSDLELDDLSSSNLITDSIIHEEIEECDDSGDSESILIYSLSDIRSGYVSQDRPSSSLGTTSSSLPHYFVAREPVGGRVYALADAVLQLDFIHSIHNPRRFAYLAQILINLIIDDGLLKLSGSMQKIVFRMTESIANYIAANRDSHDHVLRHVMSLLTGTIATVRVWGSHLGSSALIARHGVMRQRIINSIEAMQTVCKQDLATWSSSDSQGLHPLSVAPAECWQHIALHLDHCNDVESLSRCNSSLAWLATDAKVWTSLIEANFSSDSIRSKVAKYAEPTDNSTTDANASLTSVHSSRLKELFCDLRRTHGLKAISYPETLFLCPTCRTLFWPNTGHPCRRPLSFNDRNLSQSQSQQNRDPVPPSFVSVSPDQFVSYFSV